MAKWKIKSWLTVKIEGFQIAKFLTLCKGETIGFQQIRWIDDCTIQCEIEAKKLPQIRSLAQNRYQITVIGRSGLESRLWILCSRSATCVGLVCFCIIIYVQSLFISQIEIRGYERHTEREIRETLEELGFYPGALKSFDLQELKLRLFHELHNITWVGITFEGTLAKVEILEGTEIQPLEDTSYPAHLISDREGYLETLMVKEGVAQKERGDHVKAGDILISGIVPIVDKTYQREEDELIRLVHAQGEAKLRVLHRFTCYQPKISTILEDTGRWFPGIHLQIGTWSWDSDEILRPWNSSRRDEIVRWEGTRPIPASVTVYRQKEVVVRRGNRTDEEIRKRAEQQIRLISKEILPKDAHIIKKDLSFSEKENIIIMNVLLHSLESSGVDQPIQTETQ